MRKTKIIATIGPATRPPEMLARLIEAGCNIVRINMSHSTQEEAAGIIADLRMISDRVAILIDTKGPEVRTTAVEAPVTLATGDVVEVRGEPGPTTAACIRVSFAGFHRAMEEGARVLLADGQIELEVTAVHGDALRCQVNKGGILGSCKGVNVPGVRLPMPFMSEQDISDVRFAVRHQVDFIAASFVTEADDIEQIRALVRAEGGDIGLIAKVESRSAVKNLAEIVAVADGVMVARGDLGVEIPAEEVPVVQRRIIGACRAAGRPVIVATEMLESMISNPRPTRAETSDVANAIFDGTDAVMLSGETSVGRYAIEAVETMGRIARIAESEANKQDGVMPGGAHPRDVTELVCRGAWLAAKDLNVAAIVVPTSSGRTARRMSRFRPRAPILATTPDMATTRRLQLSYGVFSLPTRHYGRMENMIRRSCQLMVENGMLGMDDLIAVVCGVPVGRSGTTNLLTLQSVRDLALSRDRD